MLNSGKKKYNDEEVKSIIDFFTILAQIQYDYEQYKK
jgi:hypothetical protein